MAWSLQWYKNSLLAWMWDVNAQQAVMSETPWFNMFANTNQTNVPWMDILNPTERRNQEYDTNAMRAEALNKEVEIWLWTRVDNVMSDADKQSYLNSLTKNQYNQMLKYKNEWYWFMASKALLENSYKLADPNATWLMKYKDYADKDAYYYNNSSNWVSNFVERYLSNPLWKLSKWWNEDLWFAEDAQRWNVNFADRFANLTIWNIINWLDTAAKGIVWIVDEGESKVKSLYDKVVKWYDTDWDFYDKDREETIVDKIIDTAYGAWESVLWAVWLIPNPVSFWVAAWLSTEPWEKLGWLTIWTISKLVDETLSLPWIRAWYNLLSDDSKDKVSTWLAMIITGKAAKAWGAKLSAKAEPYIKTTKEMVQNWLNKWAAYAKVQADFEEFSKTKWWTEREDWTFVETENYNPWYRGRVASEFWEWFKEGVKEKFNNPNWTNLSERGSTPYQEWLQWWEIPTWWENVNKTNANNTQSNWIVNTIWASQLRQWNKMNKVQWIKFANRYWTDYWTWMAQRWFNQSYDNNINQLIDYDKYMQNQKRQALWAITQRYREPAVDDMLLEAINRAEYIKSDDLWKLQNLALKNEQWGLTPADIDYVRQRFWYNFPLRFDGTDIAWTTQRNNNMYMRVKDVLERIADENWIPQLRDINREIAATHHIIEWTTRYYNWIATNDIVSLKDLITLAWTVANPSARPLFVIQQSLKMPKVRDAILGKLIKGKTNEERNQIKIDFDKIRKIQNEAEQRRMLEEWIAKWNLKVEEATKAMQNRLPADIVKDPNSWNWWWVEAWDRWFMATYWDWPTYWELWLGNIRETASPQYLLRAIIEQLKESNLIKDINTSEAINQILANLSPEAQAKLAQIANKLANWRELTPEEWKVVEKLADIIRQDQDSMGVKLRWFDVSNHPYKDYIEWVPVEELKKFKEFDRLWEDANSDSKENIENLRQLIRENKLNQPLILQYSQWNRKALLVEWNHRIVAAELEWLDAVPVRVMRIKRDLDKGVEVTWIEPNQHWYVEEDLRPSEIGIKVVEDWLDIPEWTDKINPTDLPTNNPTNDWTNQWGTEWGISWPQESWWVIPWWKTDGWVVLTTDWWWTEGVLWKDVRGLWDTKGTVWPSDKVTEITNPEERTEILDSIDKDWYQWFKLNRDDTNDESFRTIASKDKNVLISIDEDWTISEFARGFEATPEDVKEVVLAWLDIWWNKINSAPALLSSYLEWLWFRVIARTWEWADARYFLAHNWESSDVVREKFEKYQKNIFYDKVKTLSTEEAIKRRDEYMDDNVWELSNIQWWTWLKNYEDFDSKFTTEKQIKQYILDNFAEIKWNATPERKALYNELLAKSKEIYNWHISTKETNLRYLNKIGGWTTLWKWQRRLIKITLWTSNGGTPAHEFTHNLDWKFWKELTWWGARLSEIVAYLIDYWIKKKENAWKKAELIWEFVDIYKDIIKRGRDRDQFYSWNKTYWTHPREEMARFWDGFVNFVKTWEPMSNYWEIYPKGLMVRYAEWLWKLDEARENWELDDWTLKSIYNAHDSRPLEIEWVWKVFVLVVDEY